MTNNVSNQLNSNNQLHDNSLTYDMNAATSINDAQSIHSNGSYMNDDVSIVANDSSSTNNELNDPNSIANDIYTSQNLWNQ